MLVAQLWIVVSVRGKSLGQNYREVCNKISCIANILVSISQPSLYSLSIACTPTLPRHLKY